MQKPSDRVIEAFKITKEIEPISGGEDRCWRAGELILKPCEKAEFWVWMAEYLPTVKAEGFRLPLPVCDRDGQWIVDGWCILLKKRCRLPTGQMGMMVVF